MKNKKDIYDVIGMFIRDSRVIGRYESGEEAVKQLAINLANYFERADNTFNKDRFLKISNPKIRIKNNIK